MYIYIYIILHILHIVHVLYTYEACKNSIRGISESEMIWPLHLPEKPMLVTVEQLPMMLPLAWVTVLPASARHGPATTILELQERKTI